MTGIVNSTGAKSGIIGTTVGTPVAAGIDCDADSWFGWLTDDTAVSGATIDFEPVRLGSNITESGGVYTVATAGWYLLSCLPANNGSYSTATELRFRKGVTNIMHRIYWDLVGTSNGYAYNGKMFTFMVEASASDNFSVYGDNVSLQGSTSGDGHNTMSSFSGVRLGA